METVLRGLAIYVFLLIVFQIAGRRTLGQTTTFDLVLLLLISEATQQALLGDDYSVTNGVILIITLVMADVGLSLLKQRSVKIDQLIDGVPLIVLEDGKPLVKRMQKARIDEEDILMAARQLHGIEDLGQVRYAVLERSGEISIIPRPSEQTR